MRKNSITFIVVLVTAMQTWAQLPPGRISGRVSDNQQQPLAAVTINLLRAGDSSLVKIALSNAKGEYLFEQVPAGDYRLQLTAVGFATQFSSLISIKEDKNQWEMEPMQLSQATKDIGGVTVTARRPFIESRIDKTVVNVDASPTSAGSTALEVLEKSPGIMVNNDGVISLRGKAGVTVMLDGRQTYLSATDLANLLRNMPASAIDQIEIMTNPSARFDAAGNSGIINIKTKKGRAGGFNGSVMVGFTSSFFTQNGNLYVIPKTQNSFNFNYRKNKINFFGNYNPNIFRGRNRQQINRVVLDDTKTPQGYVDVESRFRFGNNNHTLKLGLDYFADKKNTFGVVLTGFDFSGHPRPYTTTTTADPDGNVITEMRSFTDNRLRFRNFTSNFNYRHQFDTTGRELTADLDYVAYDNISRMTLSTDFYDESGQPAASSLLLRGRLPSAINIYSAKTDYVHPLKGGARFEAGLKASYVSNDNLVDYTRWIDSKWVPDDRSNHFVYKENIMAAYANASGKWGKWSLQGGLRLETTTSRGYQVTNDSSFRREFVNLFPSVFASYALNPENQLTLSYSRRITRPNYQDLNPFVFFLDSLSYRRGNPFLTPQFTHNIELSHSFKGKFITTFNYNHTTDVIAQIMRPDGDIVYLTTDNVARYRNIGIALTAPLTLARWWNVNLFANVYNNHYKGVFDTRPLDLGYTSFLVNMTQTFTLKQGLTLELSGFYRGRTMEQLIVSEPMYMFSFGGQKTVLNGKGTVRLNVRDPFWLQRFKGHVQYDLVDSRISNRWDNRQVTATFTYRFGKSTPQNQAPRRRNSAAQDEQNRVGQGGS